MATSIASIPVLSGNVGKSFEQQAQATYESCKQRTAVQKKAAKDKYEQGMNLVKRTLAKAKFNSK